MTTVLVVDDSAVDRCLVRELIVKQLGWLAVDAAHGGEALERMKQSAPDVVVTDLQMPVMDGLELVTAVRTEYPHVPVVLMTAYGSEALAVEALKEGAASYVPKSQLVDVLPATLEQVTALSRANRRHEQLVRSLAKADLVFSLDSDVTLIDAVVDQVQQMVLGMGLCGPTGRLRVGVALDQALRNALYHGNLEIGAEEIQAASENLLQGRGLDLIEQRRRQMPYCQRRISLEVHLTSDEARFVVSDQGPGFDVAALPGRDNPAALEAGAGRGLVLMRAFMDEVDFNRSGNEVTMIKRRDSVMSCEEP